MGIDYYNCGVCDEIFPDVSEYNHCINCEEMVAMCCYEEQKEKHGVIGEDHEETGYYSPYALLKCDRCSKEEQKDRIRTEIITCLENNREFELIKKFKEMF